MVDFTVCVHYFGGRAIKSGNVTTIGGDAPRVANTKYPVTGAIYLATRMISNRLCDFLIMKRGERKRGRSVVL